MNAAVLIASRELRDRTRFFLIAACMAVVPFVAAFAVRENRPLAIATVAGFVASAYTSALALSLGVSMVGRDLSEKRMSFLFTKPVSAASIWIGKVTAGILTWLGAFVIVILPTYVFAHRGWTDMWTAGGGAITTYTLIMSTSLFFASHAASTTLRSRSLLVAVDFALLVIMVIAFYAVMRPILLGGGLDLVLTMMTVIGVTLLAVLVVAPVWQISRGRIDPRRNHAAFSMAFWSGAAIVLLAAAGYSWWVISPNLSSIDQRNALEQSASGRWLYLSGQTPRRGAYLASFLVDTATGRSERVPVSTWSGVHFSNDGKSIVWMQAEGLFLRNGQFRFFTRKLEPGAEHVATPLVMGMPSDAALSDDGSRVAVISGQQLSVYELASGRLLGAANGFDGRSVADLVFAGPRVVRVIERSPDGLRIREFDMTRRKVATTLERPSPARSSIGTKMSADGSRIFIRHASAVFDTHTGALLATLPITAQKPFFNSMLRNGSMIVTRDAKLYHFDRNGKLIGEVPLPVPQAAVVGELGESKLLLGVTGANPKQWRMLIVDLAKHELVTNVDGVLGPIPAWSMPVLRRFDEGAQFIGVDSARNLVVWDARTGAKRPFGS
jgi:ABC-type transport system involved in multi-copper enzyme maturation permease subunit